MPLKSGKSNIGSNIKDLEGTGRPYRQALAIALKTAGIPKRRADGGGVSDGFTGALTGDTPGRDDKVPATVPDGSHVIPSDVVSALGGGNSAAGLKVLSKIFPAPKAGTAPKTHIAAAFMPRPVHLLAPRIKMPIPRMPHMHGMPRADGGADKKVEVDLSDGEFVVPPAHVARIGEGDMERGHAGIDHWIMKTRREDIEHRKNLPGPVGSGL